ncbi:MAG: alpha/beta fold hydrolase [Kineosporiaceae bacterium]
MPRAAASGRSDSPVESAGAVVDVADRTGLDRPVLVGNDTGGALAQIAAARHPERFGGLVLAGCDAFERFPPPLIRPFVAAAAAPWLARAAVRLLTVRPLLAEILGTEVRWLPDARTVVPLDRPDAVAEAVVGVLGRTADAAAP